MEKRGVGVSASLSTMASVTQLISLLPIPFLLSVYDSTPTTQAWSFWLRLLTFLSTLLTGLISAIGLRGQLIRLIRLVTRTQSRLCWQFSLLLVVYNVLFGLSTSAVTVCSGSLAAACMESMEEKCTVRARQGIRDTKSWESALFSFSLCALLCSISVALAKSYRVKITEPELENEQREGKNMNITSDFTFVEVGIIHTVSLNNVPKVEKGSSRGKLFTPRQLVPGFINTDQVCP